MNNKKWGYLIHLSTNMWNDKPPESYRSDYLKIRGLSPKLLCDDVCWRQVTEQLAWAGANMLMVDVGDGVVLPSHPELALEGSWTAERLQRELARLRGMGFEVIPKLNFSTTHDSWLKEYHRKISTPEYYRVCEDVIRDVAELFGHPKFMHIGMDEELPNFGRFTDYGVFRQGYLWWHDFQKIVGWVEACGMRAISWSTTMRHTKDYVRHTPKSVIFCVGEPAYTPVPIDAKRPCLDFAIDAAKNGYELFFYGSNWASDENFRDVVAWSRAHIPDERVLGYLMAPWVRTLPQFKRQSQRAINYLEDAMLLTGVKAPPLGIRAAFAAWIVDKDMKTVLQFKYPEDRMSLKAGETLVLDFGVGAERPVLDTRVSEPATVRLRTANTLDGWSPVFLPGSSTAECRPFEDRSEPSTPLTPGRYLAVTADKAVNFTKIAVRADGKTV